MLTANLVRAWRRGDRLFVRQMNRNELEEALEIAQAYIDIAMSHEGQSREDFDTRCAGVDIRVQDRKLAAGLLKLVHDRCVFEMFDDVDPVALREAVFRKASRKRQAAANTSDFNRDDILNAAGAELTISGETADSLLFCDLKDAHRLQSFESVSPAALVEIYQKSQGQAVLLKATRVTVVIQTDVATSLRRFFHKLKFLGLLHVITALPNGGYRIDIDGPFSMFRQGTKYGLKLASLVPALDECGTWKLDAQVIWGKEKQPLRFHMEGESQGDSTPDEPRLADEVAVLLERFNKLGSEWNASPSTDVLELPGVGLCIPDLTFVHHSTGEVAYLEVMGFWSRDAVWKRVELVEAGLPQRIVFAFSSRLRVSEEVLGDDVPGALYVYKGVMNAARIAEMLNAKSP
ncbi:MAG: DUF790 family protein [Deltaproteobacteria bacterium]|nr:DUF790 family protein [Deltaproteobacteria bacterium]MBN2671959.1 DUF790 family protein [Deltaproteobacteria bacterium]